MNPDVKGKWTTALRSGEFVQGTGALRTVGDDEFCCLGVLCELAYRDGVIPAPTVGEGGSFYEYGLVTEARSTAILPDSVAEWAGISPGGYIGDDPDLRTRPISLTSENDQGVTFSLIADMIEDNA